MFAYPLEIIKGNVLFWKLLLQACWRAIDRVAVTRDRMASRRGWRWFIKYHKWACSRYGTRGNGNSLARHQTAVSRLLGLVELSRLMTYQRATGTLRGSGALRRGVIQQQLRGIQ